MVLLGPLLPLKGEAELVPVNWPLWIIAVGGLQTPLESIKASDSSPPSLNAC